MTIRILPGDCRDVLATLPDASVHCVVTSPPYFGLRDYGTAQWDGGDAECGHTRPVSFKSSTLGASTGGRSDETHERSIRPIPYADTCGKCGARRVDRQIGLEASPAEFIAQMVAVFREVRRVLRPDGTLFLNLGDSYAGGGGFSVGAPSNATSKSGMYGAQGALKAGGIKPGNGIKPKDLLMMPARVALALQQDGWWLRSQMPWIKRSCMPESTTDRPTSAIEYVYLLTKSPRYFWDGEAVKRQSVSDHPSGNGYKRPQQVSRGGRGADGQWDGVGGTRAFRNSDLFFDSLEAPHGAITDANGDMLALDVNPAGFADAHFATFPARLVEPLIRAGTSERGCCAACGKQWVRVTSEPEISGRRDPGGACGGVDLGMWQGRAGTSERTTTGWTASCTCNAGAPVPATVLDPFAGAATTLLVADRLQRHAIGVELSPDYCDMARRRIERDAGMFATIADEDAMTGGSE